MRYVRYAFLAALGIILVTLALANRGAVQIRALPEEMAGVLGFSWGMQLPLFVIIFLSIAAGLLIGFVWEWLREHKHRAEAARKRSEVTKLEREIRRLKGKAAEEKGQDEILALLEDAGTAR